MRLVLDTNILVAALIKNSVTREILIHPEMEYIVSEFVFQEIELNKAEILQKSKLSRTEFDTLLENLKENLVLVPDQEIKHKNNALEIMRAIDINDSIFIALALSVQNEGIWSEDKHFEQQKTIKILKTKDIIDHLGITNH